MNTPKAAHDLHLAPSREDLVDRLARRGIDVVQLATSRLPPGSECAILCVGSISEGTGTSASDLDLMVLVNGAKLTASNDELTVRTRHSVEYSSIYSGIEVGFEYVDWHDLRPLRRSLTEMAGYLSGSGGAFTFLERFQIRFLHRLRSGWILAGHHLTEKWRTLLGTDALPGYLAVTHLVLSVEGLEDAAAQIGVGTAEAIYTARNCVEHGVIALRCSLGMTSPTRRFMFRPTADLGSLERELLQRGLRLLFPDFVTDAHLQQEYMEAVAAFLEDVQRCVTSDASLQRAVRETLGKTSYVLPNWLRIDFLSGL